MGQIHGPGPGHPKLIKRLMIVHYSHYYQPTTSRRLIYNCPYEQVRVSMAENSSGHEKSNVQQFED